MGSDTVPQRYDATTILATWFNIIRSAINGDWVPRNSSGVATSEGGSLGTATYPWLKASISSGYFSIGDIKMHHTYNGAAAIGHGWMLCDGRVITEAAYNTEHGASTFATYIGSTALLNKYLPNFTSKYPIGVAATTQSGSIAITSIGNVGHSLTTAGHTHTGPSHNHAWYTDSAGGIDTTYDSGGSAKNINTSAIAGGTGIPVDSSGTPALVNTSYTNMAGTGATSLNGAVTIDVRPESIEVQFYMRII